METGIATGVFFNDKRGDERKKSVPKTLVHIEKERRREIYVITITW